MSNVRPLSTETTEDWPAIIPLTDSNKPPALDPGFIPSWAGEFAEAISKFSETPRELAISMVMATVSVAAARRLQVEVAPGHSEPANLWLMCCLDPGNRKSSVHGAATRPLVDWERDQAERLKPEICRAKSEAEVRTAQAAEVRKQAARADGSERERLIEESAAIESSIEDIPKPPRLWTSDCTPEKLGVLLADHGETIGWLSAEGGVFDLLAGRYCGGIPNLDLILKAHSSDPDRVDRGSRPPVFLHQPRLTIGITPQPETLRGLAANRNFLGRGLLARFLYFLPESNLGDRTHDGPPVPEAISSAYEAGIRGMLDWPAAVGPNGTECLHLLKLSSRAEALRLRTALVIEKRFKTRYRESPSMLGWAGKAVGAAVRVAGVLHAIKHAHGEPWSCVITGETMQQAVHAIEVSEHHTRAAFSIMADSEHHEASLKILDWIRREGRDLFLVRDCFRKLSGSRHFGRTDDLRRVLDLLAERGYLIVSQTDTPGPGRPAEIVRINPDFLRANE